MINRIELEQNILIITNMIYRKFPELSKYLIEMPEKKIVNDEINIKDLQDYYDSLENIVSKYSQTHLESTDNSESEISPGCP